MSALTERKIDASIGNQNKVKSMATQLLAKFEENAPVSSTGIRRQVGKVLCLLGLNQWLTSKRHLVQQRYPEVFLTRRLKVLFSGSQVNYMFPS